MVFSREVLGTANKKTKLSWWDYWINHCWMTGWQRIKHSFQNWGDLMTVHSTPDSAPLCPIIGSYEIKPSDFSLTSTESKVLCRRA